MPEGSDAGEVDSSVRLTGPSPAEHRSTVAEPQAVQGSLTQVQGRWQDARYDTGRQFATESREGQQPMAVINVAHPELLDLQKQYVTPASFRAASASFAISTSQTYDGFHATHWKHLSSEIPTKVKSLSCLEVRFLCQSHSDLKKSHALWFISGQLLYIHVFDLDYVRRSAASGQFYRSLSSIGQVPVPGTSCIKHDKLH